MFDKLVFLLQSHQASFRVVEHPPEGNSERVAALRQTAVGQGAKAMMCTIEGSDILVMSVVPGDHRVNLKRVAQHFGHKKAHFMSIDQAQTLTGCVIGAIPPFTFHPQLRLLLDPQLKERYSEIAFNAGRLDRSIVLAVDDYLRIAKPELTTIIQI